MSIQNKPDYQVFASDAKANEIELFPDILRGWGITIERTGEVPPMEWFNALGKRVDEWLLYLTQRGVPEWDSSLDYPVGAMVFTDGKFYVSLKENKAKKPTLSSADWKDFTKFFGIDKKLDKSDVVQTTGNSTTEVMSQKAVTDALNDIASQPDINFISVEESWTDGYNGYRVYSDGFCEQWGFVSETRRNLSVDVNLYKAYKDTNYNLNTEVRTQDSTGMSSSVDTYTNVQSITTTSFKVNIFEVADNDLRLGFYWHTWGYIR